MRTEFQLLHIHIYLLQFEGRPRKSKSS